MASNRRHKTTPETQLEASVRRVLLTDWDPIGVCDFPDGVRAAAQDEYDPYLSPIVAMILDGSDESVLENHLSNLERQYMGGRVRSPERVAKSAQILATLAPL